MNNFLLIILISINIYAGYYKSDTLIANKVTKSNDSGYIANNLKVGGKIIGYSDSSIKSYHAVIADTSIKSHHSILSDSSIASYRSKITDSSKTVYRGVVMDSAKNSNHTIIADSAEKCGQLTYDSLALRVIFVRGKSNESDSIARLMMQGDGGSRYWFTADTQKLCIGGTGTTKPATGLINLKNNNVGIGTVPTTGKLHVTGDKIYCDSLTAVGQVKADSLYSTKGVKAATINTGHGDFEIGQNLRTTDDATFDSLHLTQNVNIYGNDHDTLVNTFNASASGARQLYVSHYDGDVNIQNLRGAVVIDDYVRVDSLNSNKGIVGTTINTGLGNFEVGQNLRTSDNVTFNTVVMNDPSSVYDSNVTASIDVASNVAFSVYNSDITVQNNLAYVGFGSKDSAGAYQKGAFVGGRFSRGPSGRCPTALVMGYSPNAVSQMKLGAVLDTSGYFGINVTNPLYRLHVGGTALFTNVVGVDSLYSTKNIKGNLSGISDSATGSKYLGGLQASSFQLYDVNLQAISDLTFGNFGLILLTGVGTATVGGLSDAYVNSDANINLAKLNFSAITNGYIPYKTSGFAPLANSPIYVNSGNIDVSGFSAIDTIGSHSISCDGIVSSDSLHIIKGAKFGAGVVGTTASFGTEIFSHQYVVGMNGIEFLRFGEQRSLTQSVDNEDFEFKNDATGEYENVHVDTLKSNCVNSGGVVSYDSGYCRVIQMQTTDGHISVPNLNVTQRIKLAHGQMISSQPTHINFHSDTTATTRSAIYAGAGSFDSYVDVDSLHSTKGIKTNKSLIADSVYSAKSFKAQRAIVDSAIINAVTIKPVVDSFPCTLGGVTTTVTGMAYYHILNNMVTLYFPQLIGTSNTNENKILGVPSLLTNFNTAVTGINSQFMPIVAEDNGVFSIHYIGVQTGGIFFLYKNGSAVHDTWTSSGNKGILRTTITYTLGK